MVFFVVGEKNNFKKCIDRRCIRVYNVIQKEQES